MPAGWTVTLYEHDKTKGDSETLTADLAEVKAGFDISNIEIVCSPNHACYYQEKSDRKTWTKNGGFAESASTADECMAWDGCMPGGSNRSCGGCYIYATSAEAAAQMLTASGRK